MIKAILDLNTTAFAAYKNIDIEKEWRSIPVIRIWLKARAFDLTLPIFVTKNEKEQTLTFFQTKTESSKTVILVHPNVKKLEQLNTSLKNAGHSVHAFSKVKDANVQIKLMSENGVKLNKIIVPTNLQVSYNFTYKQFLNKMFSKYEVITIDNKDYRDDINIRIFQKENVNVIS